MKVIAVIPARFNSKRLPGKPLKIINSKPMIQHVYERVKNSNLFSKVIIATDDKRIYDCAKSFTSDVVMTSRKHQSGTERVAEVVKKEKCDYVLNVQGDEPLIAFTTLKSVVDCCVADGELDVITAVYPVKNKDDIYSPNVVKAVLSNDNYVIYFSRLPIPFIRDKKEIKSCRYFKHIGIYLYKRDFLLKFFKMRKGYLEFCEKLEQLRILENGYKIKAVIVRKDSIAVDTPSDLIRVRKIYEKRNKNIK